MDGDEVLIRTHSPLTKTGIRGVLERLPFTFLAISCRLSSLVTRDLDAAPEYYSQTGCSFETSAATLVF